MAAPRKKLTRKCFGFCQPSLRSPRLGASFFEKTSQPSRHPMMLIWEKRQGNNCQRNGEKAFIFIPVPNIPLPKNLVPLLTLCPSLQKNQRAFAV
jgi:hypothetical protein